MSNLESTVLVIAIVAVLVVAGNVIFQIVAERKHPPIGRFIDCDGVRLHYIDRGNVDAPCMILFHGNGTMLQDLTISGLVDLLASHNRVLCFDRPGFGYSRRPRSRIWTPTAQAALFTRALRQLGVHNPVVLGHSWGTLVAVALALRNDYPIRGLVLASGYYFPNARLDFWLLSGPAIPIIGDLIRYTVAPIISWLMMPSLLRKLFAPRPDPQKFKDAFPVSLAIRPKQLRAAAEESAFLIPAAAQFQPQYSRIECPVRIFHGAEDKLIEPEQSRHLHEVIGRSVLELAEHTGHMVTYAEAPNMARAMASLLS
jgi:pimeloyl-ACP methyl ester carboxylesterase